MTGALAPATCAGIRVDWAGMRGLFPIVVSTLFCL